MKKDLGSEEGVVLVEVSLIEDQQELDPVIQGLDGMGNTARRYFSLV